MTRFPILLLSILFSLVSLSLLDFERALVLRVEGVVERFHSPVTYRHLGDGVFEFTDTLSGHTFRKQVTDVKPQGGKQPKKIITIDVTQIDTTGFGSMFRLVDRISIGTGTNTIQGHIGSDGKRYLIGGRNVNGSYTSSYIFARDTTLNKFTQIHEYTGFGFAPIGMGIVYSMNGPHFLGDSSGSVIVYETPVGTNLPVKRGMARYGTNESVQFPRVYDFDGDGVDEVVLRNAISVVNPRVVVSKFDSSNLTFIDPFNSDLGGKNPYGSWAVGDFDLDNKGEFATVTYGGFVYFVEYNPLNSSYSVVFIDTTRSVNAGFNYEGNDLDRDGRPEVFIGSSFFGGLANIAVYETVGDNDFEVSLWIEIRGIGALKEGVVTGDVDGDGRDELIVNLGGVVLVLKATTDDRYDVMWMKILPSEVSVRLFDTDGDGSQELLIGLFDNRAGFTEIYSLSKPLGVEAIHSDFRLDVFPNPMKSDGYIMLSSERHQDVLMRIFDSGGSIVKEHHERRFAGFLSIRIGNYKLPAGLYFIQAESPFHTITKKIVIL